MIKKITKNSLIQQSIEIHDSFQFEMKYAYKVSTQKKITSYDVETYIFLPTNLGIHKTSYSKNDFYSDIQNYIRLKTPTILLKNILDDGSLFPKLEKYFVDLTKNCHEAMVEKVIYRLKLLACVFKSSVRENVEFMHQAKTGSELEYMVENHIDSLNKIIQKFRKLKMVINVPTVPTRVLDVFMLTDEYLSQLIEENCYKLLNLIRTKKNSRLMTPYNKKILGIIEQEIIHRRENNYPSVPNLESDNEELIYRRATLKKYIGSALFLRRHSQKVGTVLEQLIFSIAAALAVFFVSLFSLFGVEYTGSIYISVASVIMAYVFKDRLKEVLKNFFQGKIAKYLADQRTLIFSDSKVKIGSIEESFNFISENLVPEKIKRVRNRQFITAVANEGGMEQVISFRKKIKIYSGRINKIYDQLNINGINDIMRFNIQKYLFRMDNPEKSLLCYNEEKHDFKEIKASRVYHVNMILRYTKDHISEYKRYRLILTRNGIKRIETV